MINISLHIPSLLVGAVIGYAVVALIWILTANGEQWHVGFSEGFKAGNKKREENE